MFDQRFSLSSSNTYRFQDGQLDLELSCHPLLRRETISLDGQIAYEIRNSMPGWGYEFDFNGHDYMLVQDQPEDESCSYYYELSRDGESLQRYEITPTRKIPPAIICLVALSLLIFFTVAAGELSESYLDVSVLDWHMGVKLAVMVAAALSTLGLTGLIIATFGRPTIKSLIGDQIETGIVTLKFDGDTVSVCEVRDSR